MGVEDRAVKLYPVTLWIRRVTPLSQPVKKKKGSLVYGILVDVFSDTHGLKKIVRFVTGSRVYVVFGGAEPQISRCTARKSGYIRFSSM